MCGISGIFARDPETRIPGEWIRWMMDAQAHRGPDDALSVEFRGCVLGFNRLSVLDVSTNGRQPMTVDGSARAIVYNGEIYNFVELGREHAERGVRFRSRSDTEVLLHSFVRKGEDCLNDFNGMWALAVYDPVEETLFAARDRFGVKPFYYYMDESFFCFASEIKALLRLPFVPRVASLPTLFGGMFERANDRTKATSFDKILQLPPAHFQWIRRRDWTIKEKRYWSIRPAEPTSVGNDANEMAAVADEFRSLLRSAVRLRLRSDRPMGLLLSGGMDSSSIAACLAEIRESGEGDWSEKAPQLYTLRLPAGGKHACGAA